MRRALIGAAALVLVLTGCEMRAEVTVNGDGSGTFGFAFGIEETLFGQLPGGREQFLAGARAQLADDPVPWEVTEFDEPGMRGVRATVRFRDLDHMRELMEALAAEQGVDAGGFADFTLERSGSGWRLEARGEAAAPGAFGGGTARGGGQDLPPGFEGELPGGSGLEEQLLGPGAPEGLDQVLRFEFHVTLPGSATSHNAAEVRSAGGKTTFIWRPSTTAAETVSMRAQTTAAGGSLPLVPIAAALAALVLGAYVLTRRRGGRGGLPPVVLEGLPTIGVPAEIAATDAPDEREAAAGGG